MNEVDELFLDLDAKESQIEFPIVYTNAKAGWAPPRRTTKARIWPAVRLLIERSRRRGTKKATRFRRASRTSTPTPMSAASRCAASIRGTIAAAAGRLVPPRRLGRERQIDRAVRERRAARVPRTAPGPGEIIALAGIPGSRLARRSPTRTPATPLPVIAVEKPALGMTIGSHLAARRPVGNKLTARQVEDRLQQDRRQRRDPRRRHHGRTPGRSRGGASCSSPCSSSRCGGRVSS